MLTETKTELEAGRDVVFVEATIVNEEIPG